VPSLSPPDGGGSGTPSSRRASDIGGPVGVGEEAVVTDAVEPVGQDMDQEAADELVGVERHPLVAGVALGPVILPFERHALAVDKAYDVTGFVADLRQHNATPHVAQNTTNRRSAIDRRTTRHSGYAVSGRVRKRIEEVFGWSKAAAGFRKPVTVALLASARCSP
jgi:hypothetical protein